jgi:twitching motility protein PilT
MVPAVEIMVSTARVKELIEDAARTKELHDAIAQGLHPYGMISFDQCLTDLVKKRMVTYAEALSHATNPDDFALHFRGVAGSTDESWHSQGSYQQPGAAPSRSSDATSDDLIERFNK